MNGCPAFPWLLLGEERGEGTGYNMIFFYFGFFTTAVQVLVENLLVQIEKYLVEIKVGKRSQNLN